MLSCTQENKNSRFFSFCAALVEFGITDCIEINFLPVGHTHGTQNGVMISDLVLSFGLCVMIVSEDIDQRFSLISKDLNMTPCRSLSELMANIRKAV